ncbi:uncharacterized protein [Ptychodera flava]|uniref:uncharacterized protein n=1 Tax=Ptychodera flava TaxID=63121 RepID=UPI003969ED0A
MKYIFSMIWICNLKNKCTQDYHLCTVTTLLRNFHHQDFYHKLQVLSQSPDTHKKIYRGRVMLVGAYGAGKTSTKRSLFKEPYEEKHISTDGADIYNIDITEWIIKEFTTKYQGKKSIEETQKILGDVLIRGYGKRESRTLQKQSEMVPAKVVDVIEAVKLKGEKIRDVETRLLKRLEEADDIDKPDIYFSLWDFAGQSVYYITHQVFLGNRVIFVLVTDLTKSLDDMMSTVVEDEWTVKDFLCFWVNSIHTHAHPDSKIRMKLPDGHIENTPAPPVIILGTKKDLLAQVRFYAITCIECQGLCVGIKMDVGDKHKRFNNWFA